MNKLITLLKNITQQRIPFYNTGFFNEAFHENLFDKKNAVWYDKMQKESFLADPFVYETENKKYIFVEEYDYKTEKGHISVIEEGTDGTWKAPEPIIKENFHLSYPFILKYENELFLIPESYQNGELTAYKCIEFPLKWEKYKTIKKGPIVDANLFFADNKWWLFYSKELEPNYSNTYLFLEFSDSPFGEWQSHPQNPIKSDIANSRNAGRIFKWKDKIIRPSQNCKEHYGHKLVLNEIIVLNETKYEERQLTEIEPLNYSNFPDGIHHISITDSFVVFDGMKYLMEWRKPAESLHLFFSYLKSKINK